MPAVLHTPSPSLTTSPVYSLRWSLRFPVFFLLGKELSLNKHLLYAQQFPPMTLSLLRLSFLPFFCYDGLFPFFLTCFLSPGHFEHLPCARLFTSTASPAHYLLSPSRSPSPLLPLRFLPALSAAEGTGKGHWWSTSCVLGHSHTLTRLLPPSVPPCPFPALPLRWLPVFLLFFLVSSGSSALPGRRDLGGPSGGVCHHRCRSAGHGDSESGLQFDSFITEKSGCG